MVTLLLLPLLTLGAPTLNKKNVFHGQSTLSERLLVVFTILLQQTYIAHQKIRSGRHLSSISLSSISPRKLSNICFRAVFVFQFSPKNNSNNSNTKPTKYWNTKLSKYYALSLDSHLSEYILFFMFYFSKTIVGILEQRYSVRRVFFINELCSITSTIVVETNG